MKKVVLLLATSLLTIFSTQVWASGSSAELPLASDDESRMSLGLLTASFIPAYQYAQRFITIKISAQEIRDISEGRTDPSRAYRFVFDSNFRKLCNYTHYSKEKHCDDWVAILLINFLIESLPLREDRPEELRTYILSTIEGPEIRKIFLKRMKRLEMNLSQEEESTFEKLENTFQTCNFPAPHSDYEALKNQLLAINNYEATLQDLLEKGDAFKPQLPKHLQALQKSFWKQIAQFIEELHPVYPLEKGPPQYLNIVKLLTEKLVPDLQLGGTQIDRKQWDGLCCELEAFAFSLGFTSVPNDKTYEFPNGNIIPAHEDTVRAARPILQAHNIQTPYHPVTYIHLWFKRLMETQEAHSSKGQRFLRRRVKKIVEQLKIHASESTKNTDEAKFILQEHIIGNAKNCSDRALFGLDSAEIYIKLWQARDIQETLAIIIQKNKKTVLEFVVDQGRSESVEEYLYLMLILNQRLALGLTWSDMSYGGIGARKNFEQALKGFLSHISYQAMIDMTAQDPIWAERLGHFNPLEYREKISLATCERDTASEALETNVLEDASTYKDHLLAIDRKYKNTVNAITNDITRSIFDPQFLLTGSKYSGFTRGQIKEIDILLKNPQWSSLPESHIELDENAFLEIKDPEDLYDTLIALRQRVFCTINLAAAQQLEDFHFKPLLLECYKRIIAQERERIKNSPDKQGTPDFFKWAIRYGEYFKLPSVKMLIEQRGFTEEDLNL